MKAWLPVLVALLGVLILPACEGVNLTAPTGAVLTVTVSPSTIGIGQTANVTAIATQSTGFPVADGTTVYFTTTLGTITPTGETNDGIAHAVLTAGTTTGMATVTASSGPGMAGTFNVTIGISSAPIGTVTLNADPAVLPPGGGQSNLTALVLGDNGQPLSGVPVVFSTTAGSLSSSGAAVPTDSSGRARNTLTTDRTTTVTAAAGERSATFEIRINSGSSIVVNANPASIPNPEGGQSQITATVFADNGQPLANAPLVFTSTAGTLASNGQLLHTNTNGQATDTLTTNIAATVSVTSGNLSGSVQVAINLAPVADFTFSPTSPRITDIITFDGGTSRDSDGIVVSWTWDFGDGTGSFTGQVQQHQYTVAQTYSVTLTVRDNQGAQSTIIKQVTVSNPAR
jgi:adhesin/invasin